MLIVLVTVIAVALLMLARAGPRVTRIEHRREDDDEREDRDDA